MDAEKNEYVKLCFELWQDIRLFIIDTEIDKCGRRVFEYESIGILKETVYRREKGKYLDMGFDEYIVNGIPSHGYCPCCMEATPCEMVGNEITKCLLKSVWPKGCLGKGSPYLAVCCLLRTMRNEKDKENVILEINKILGECLRLITEYEKCMNDENSVVKG